MEIRHMQHLSNAIEGAADWRRRKAEEYPDDDRNRDAVAELTRLAETVPDVSDKRVAQYDALWKDDRADRAVEIESEMLRSVGFSAGWKTAEQFIAELVERVAR
jgi:hypothetical protein